MSSTPVPASETAKQIDKSVKKFSLGSIFAQITSKLRDISMAEVFGTSTSISAFYFSMNLVSIIRRFLGKGIVHYIFVPQFETLRKNDPKRAFSFFRDLFATVTAILLSLTFLFEGALWLFLHFSNWSQELCDSIRLFALILPSVIFICLFGLSSALLSCEKSFFLSTAAPVAFNFIWIVAVKLLEGTEPKVAVTRLAITVGIATFIQWSITAPSIIRLLKSEISRQWWSNLKCFSKDLRILVKPLLFGSLGIGAMQINSFIDNVFATYFVTTSAPSYLWFSIKMYQIPLDLFSLALSVVLLPSLSRAIEEDNRHLFRHLLDSSLRRAIYLMIPSSLFLVSLGGVLINTFYNRGSFTDVSVYETSRCLMAYGLGLLPQTCVLMLVPACYALKAYEVPVYAAIVSLLANTFLDGLFTIVFGWGAFSVALATSICTGLNCYLLQRFLVIRLGMSFISPGFGFFIRRVLIAAIATAMVTAIVGHLVFQDPTFEALFSQTIPEFSRNETQNWIQAGALGAVFMLMLILLYSAMRVKATLEPLPESNRPISKDASFPQEIVALPILQNDNQELHVGNQESSTALKN
jgi:putative peptidoglycan lipid II flippase